MPVVLLPTHRSYIDFLIVSYVCFNYGLPLPRTGITMERGREREREREREWSKERERLLESLSLLSSFLPPLQGSLHFLARLSAFSLVDSLLLCPTLTRLADIAAGDDFLNIMIVNWIFRNAGAFFMRRSFKEDNLYKSIFTEYGLDKRQRERERECGG